MTRGCILSGLVLAVLFFYGAGMAVTLEQQEGEEFFPAAESLAEYDAMAGIDEETSPANKLTLSETFLSTYPESELTYQIHQARLDAYLGLGNPRAVIEAAEAALATQTAFYEAKIAELDEPSEVPGFASFLHSTMRSKTFYYQSLMNAHNQLGDSEKTVEYSTMAHANEEADWEDYSQTLSGPEAEEAAGTHRRTQLFFLQTTMTAYQNSNDAAKTIEYAELALELDPENLATLIVISGTMAERPPEDEDAREEHLERAEEYSEDAIRSLERFLDGPAGAQIGAAQRADLLSGVHSTLGLVYLHQEEFGNAQDEYENALEALPNDPVAYFRLGEAYTNDDEIDDALEALARSVYLKGVTEVGARELLERIYQIKNGSLDDLDQFIQSEGEKIGN